jgi:hypothetical protein
MYMESVYSAPYYTFPIFLQLVRYYRELNCSVYILQTTLLKIMFVYLFHYLYTGKCCLMTEYVPNYNVINRTCKDNTVFESL